MGLREVLLPLRAVFLRPGCALYRLRGAVSAGTFVSGIAIVYEFTGAESRPTYIGLANTIPGVTGAVAPLIGGLLVGAISYQAMFSLAAVIGAVSWALLRFAVREPRKIKPSPKLYEPPSGPLSEPPSEPPSISETAPLS